MGVKALDVHAAGTKHMQRMPKQGSIALFQKESVQPVTKKATSSKQSGSFSP